MESVGDVLKRIREKGGPDHKRPPAEDGGGNGKAEAKPEVVCKVCGDKGWVTLAFKRGSPDFGKIIVCRCQEEPFLSSQEDRLRRYSNMSHVARFRFETLDVDGAFVSDENKPAFLEASSVAARYAENPEGWLILVGPNGSGKTHLAAAIANCRIKIGQPAFFIHVPDLLDHLRGAYAPTSDVSYSELYERVTDAPLLVLDGFGAHSSTPWAEEKLQQIFNYRFNVQLPTVVTMARALADIDPYIRSRLDRPPFSRVVYTAPLRASSWRMRLGKISPGMLERMTFETYKVERKGISVAQRDSLKSALRAAEGFAADPDGWLVLFGDTGRGKTHLAVAIAARRIEAGSPDDDFFAFVPDLLDELRASYAPDSSIGFAGVFDAVRNAPLLILDDLGQERSSSWAHENLYRIIAHRHNNRLPTVITSMVDMTKQAGPMGSRMRDTQLAQLVRVDAPDYRAPGS